MRQIYLMNICYLFLHRLSGRGSGRYMQSLIQYFKDKRQKLFLVEGMRSKLNVLNGVYVRYIHLPFQIPVYQGRSDVKKNIKISTVSDSQLFSMIRRFSEWQVKMNERFDLDIVHANHASILPFSAYLAKKITNVPYVVTVHGTGTLSSMENKRNFKIAKIGLHGAEKIIANSKFTKRRLIKDFCVKKNKIKVIYPSVDTGVFKPASQRVKNAIKRKYGCKGKRVVFSSGFFGEEKGFQYLLKAAQEYEKKDDRIFTMISGQGPYQKELEKMIKELGLKRTKIVGWVSRKELIKLYGTADIFVTPSVWKEPFGMVSVEALASKTPVIGTGIGGIPEIVNNDVGEIVKPRSASQIAETVLDRIFDDNWLERRGNNGRKRVSDYFSMSVQGRETEKVYKKILK